MIYAGKASPRVSWKNHGRDWCRFPRLNFSWDKKGRVLLKNDLRGGSEPLGKLEKPE